MKQLLVIISLLFSTFAWSAPKSELWPYWNQSNEANSEKVSHQDWQQFLDNYLVKQGQHALVRYQTVSSSDKTKLKQYISRLEQIDPLDYPKAEQYAYWVNLYNAVTVDLILNAYPIKSITKLGGLFSFGPWGDDVVAVNGKTLTLNDIEHRILRPIWQDPRTHYAVNCASLGCPNLQSQAFTSDNTEMLLELAAAEYINSDKGVLVNNNQLQLSSIYEWFAVDFGNQQQLIKHLDKYRTKPVTYTGKISYDYDWSLNQAN
ncbi:DUF547 domain-containing protein [Vibrio cyclitrophicus]|uniref:DUF547 domain-containing protein n=1 Tax=Vibrio TaxID=662 RepID=UPI0003030E03|nr:MULTISPECIES: DUF547 domain-containing protein [Vibrio]KNH12567.1 hypothetical protein ACS79_12505 [Vibrio lentus]ERM59618.1 Uncharacterized protein DUF547 [Vibrio cyclitrophicus FF75]NOH43973.1 DUF547 domain-containing protein [Vibrio cyclitrophicus]OEE48328.1 hypothetical protein OAG_10945 [Vibrio cyclitrophicus FF75]PMF28113.1 hypothetical protein BCV17_17545 [Vibrio cyclitrophicus]